MKLLFRILIICLFLFLSRRVSFTEEDRSKNIFEKNSFSEESIYNLDQIWTDQDGDQVLFSTIPGKVKVLTMFFSSCQYACPLLVQDLKNIENQLDPKYKNQIQFILVSFDWKRDKPKVLKKFKKNRNLDHHWTLLTGNDESVRELAAVLGVKYKVYPDGNFSHSNLITVLNEQGEIIHQQTGLKQDPIETIKSVHHYFQLEGA